MVSQIPWAEFVEKAPDMAAAGIRLFAREEIVFLATTSTKGRPRIHPFVPKIVNDRLVAFIIDSSPKFNDLTRRQFYAIHTTLGAEDEEFFVSGKAVLKNDDTDLRAAARYCDGFRNRRCRRPPPAIRVFHRPGSIWTTWEYFGTPDHRPHYHRWQHTARRFSR